MKPSFLTEWMALPAKESRQIGQKIELLTRDPTPDAKVKKQLKYMNGRLHRIRSGDYRLFYTFDHPYISLLALRRRDNDTYDEDLDTEFLGGLDPQFIGSSRVLPDWERMFARREPEKTPLPEPISVELLSSLRVPEVYHQRLELVRTREDLFDCPGISDEIKLQVDEYLFERPLVERLAEPDYLTGDISDLLRYKGGELLAFLLKLDPGQERVVDWALNSGAPTLVKGGPGTGKSILALYRVRSMIHALREAGVDQPRILFTTYTHALASYSEQLLCRLLGPDAGCVRVRTADSCAYEIAGSIPGPRAPAPDGELKYLLKQAIAVALLEGNALQASAQAMALEQMSADYLLDELSKVIEARELVTLDAYLKAPRSGRRVPLNRTQRTAVWLVHEAFNRQLVLKGRRTWQQMRRQALEAVRSGAWSERYDGVIVDEAQDLDPTLIRMLAELCKEPNGLLLTADANQSIYGSGFRWADVREDLRIQGRTVVLRVNHRSTREIGDAARSYLQEGALESYEQEPTYISSGPRPVVYSSTSAEDESNFLASFLPTTARELRVGLAACAVLVPSERAGRAVAARLDAAGIRAVYMPGRELNLEEPRIKVLTLSSAKGLEFPVVAIAGFLEGASSLIRDRLDSAELEEDFMRLRRTMFVAMTRATRALLVIIPADHRPSILTGFDERYWNLGA